MSLNVTHTYVTLEISDAAYDEIKKKLLDAEYDHVFGDDGEMDMHGIALVKEKIEAEPVCPRCSAPFLPTGQCSRYQQGCQGGWGERDLL